MKLLLGHKRSGTCVIIVWLLCASRSSGSDLPLTCTCLWQIVDLVIAGGSLKKYPNKLPQKNIQTLQSEVYIYLPLFGIDVIILLVVPVWKESPNNWRSKKHWKLLRTSSNSLWTTTAQAFQKLLNTRVTVHRKDHGPHITMDQETSSYSDSHTVKLKWKFQLLTWTNQMPPEEMLSCQIKQGLSILVTVTSTFGGVMVRLSDLRILAPL